MLRKLMFRLLPIQILLAAVVFIAVFVILGSFDLTVFLTRDLTVRPIFNRYLMGQAIGLLPFMLGSSFASFLLLENKWKRTLCASLVYIAVNVLLNFLFVKQLHMEAFGLALATALGMWVFWLCRRSITSPEGRFFGSPSGTSNGRRALKSLRSGCPEPRLMCIRHCADSS